MPKYIIQYLFIASRIKNFKKLDKVPKVCYYLINKLYLTQKSMKPKVTIISDRYGVKLYKKEMGGYGGYGEVGAIFQNGSKSFEVKIYELPKKHLRDKKTYGVNWPGCGTTPLNEAGLFQKVLTEAIKLAEEMTEIE